MSTKAKGLGKRAQLHPLDKTLYVMIILLSAFLDVVLCVSVDKLAGGIALSDSSVIYYRSSHLALLPIYFYIMLVPIIFAATRLKQRKPLLMKLQRNDRRPYTAEELEQNKKTSRTLRWTAGVLGLVCLAIAPLGIYSRETMNADGLVKIYSWKNEVEESYLISPEDASLVTFRASKPWGRSRGFRMTVISNDGWERSFGSIGFLSNSKALDFMLNFKGGLGDDVIIEYYGAEYLDWHADFSNMSSAEAAKLRELFDAD